MDAERRSATFSVHEDGELLVSVWDWDLIGDSPYPPLLQVLLPSLIPAGSDDFLGVLSIPFTDVVNGAWAAGKWSTFTRETSEKSKKKAPGEIYLAITWTPAASLTTAVRLLLSLPLLFISRLPCILRPPLS